MCVSEKSNKTTDKEKDLSSSTLDTTTSSSSTSRSARLGKFAKLLGATGPDAEFTRSELSRLVWDRVGTSSSAPPPDSVIHALFDECDADRNGLVSIEELYDYIENIHHRSMIEKIGAVVPQVAFSLTFWAFILFGVASLCGIAYNVRWRLRDGEDASFNYDGLNNLLYTFGSYAFVGDIYDNYARDLRLVERAKHKIWLFVKTKSAAEGSSIVESDDREMGPRELFSVLERGGIFLPAETFMDIFNDVDDDNSGTLSFHEIRSYAMEREKRGPLSFVDFHWAVLKECFRDIDYWLQWGWTVASIMNVMTSYHSESWPEDFVWHFDGASYVLFSVCAFLQHRLNYQSVAKTQEQTEELKQMLLNQVVDMSGAFDMSGGITRAACQIVFRHIDVSGVEGVPDGALDFVEFYDALMQAGFVFDAEVLRSIFDEADTNQDGKLQLEEFVEYVLGIDANQSVARKRWSVLRTYLTGVDFWMANSEVFGAVFLLPGNYVSSVRSSMNWYFAADVGWFVPAIYESCAMIAEAAGEYDALTYSSMNFKKIVQDALENFSVSSTKRDDEDVESDYFLTEQLHV